MSRTNSLCIPPSKLEDLRRRREAGEGITALAKEVGISWQKLWGLLKPGGGASSTKPTPTLEPTPKEPSAVASPAAVRPAKVRVVDARNGGSLTERYRPTSLETIIGQDEAVRVLKRFVENRYPAAFLFEGATGTGKTSAALALAAELGCALDQKEFGGVWSIASGDQTTDSVREMARRMNYMPMAGSGWKVVIVNEADRMSSPVETLWLDVLENIPTKAVVVFTTNTSGKMTARFRDRCIRLGFESGALLLAPAAHGLAEAIWATETGQPLDPKLRKRIVEQATLGDQLSLRRIVQAVSVELMKGGAA